MSKPVKIFLIGALCAGLIVAVGFFNTYYLESKLRTLESECVHDKGEEEVKQNELDFSLNSALVCDAAELSGLSELKGIQAQIVQIHNDIRSSKKWLYSIGLLIVLFSAAPWSWYFLLRRIREIRDVIAGE